MERIVIEYLANALWQLPLLAGCAFLLARLTKPCATTHHRLWLAVLAIALLLPLHRGSDNALTVVTTQNTSVDQIQSANLSRLGPVTEESFSSLMPRVRTVRLNATTTKWLVRLYLAAVVFGILRIGRAWNANRVLLAHSAETDRYRTMLVDCSERFDVDPPALRESTEVSSPMVVGVTKPVLVLPAGFSDFSAEEVEAALCHELAHISRRDPLINTACQVAALPLSWHPAMLLIQQRIRLTRELICDAMAAREMRSDLGYARCLLALAQSILGQNRTYHRAAVSLFSHNTFEERMTNLMKTESMSLRAKAVRLAAGGAVAIAGVVTLATFHMSLAEAAPVVVQADNVAAVTQDQAPAAAPSSQSAPAKPSPDVVRQEPRPKTRDTRPEATTGVIAPDVADIKEQLADVERESADSSDMVDAEEIKRQTEDLKEQVEKGQEDAAKAKEDAERDSADTVKQFDNAELRRQMKELQEQAAKSKADAERQFGDSMKLFGNDELRKQLENAQEQAARTRALFDSAAFKHQFEQAQKMMNSPAFKKQMEEAQAQAASTKAMMESGEFRKKLDEMRKQLGDIRPCAPSK